MAVRTHKDLVAWQRAMDLVVAVYRATREFPREEVYGLTSQIRRAAVSVPSNLAEGQGRGAGSDFQRNARIAIGSLQELETQLLIAGRLEYVAQAAVEPLLAISGEVGRLIRGLHKSLSRRQQPATSNQQPATWNQQPATP